MKIRHDGEGDTSSILVHHGQIDHTEDDGLIIANLDKNNSLIEIEILNAIKLLEISLQLLSKQSQIRNL